MSVFIIYSGAAFFQAKVRAAVQWLMIAGRELYHLVDGADHKDAIPMSDLYHGETPGFSKERWALWTSRLAWVQVQITLNEWRKTLANRAHRRMLDLEAEPRTPYGGSA